LAGSEASLGKYVAGTVVGAAGAKHLFIKVTNIENKNGVIELTGSSDVTNELGKTT